MFNKNKLKYLVILGVILLLIAEREKKREHEEYIAHIELIMDVYTYALNMKCEYPIEDNKIVIKEQDMSEWLLMIEMELYNAYYEDDMTMEELLDEFDGYCNNLVESELLDDYSYLILEMRRINGLSRQDYSSMVVGELNNRGIDWDTATDEEIKDAARSVADTLKKP